MNSTEISSLNYTLKHGTRARQIQLELHSTFQGIENVLSRKIIDTEEKAIRDSLVQLGWTPPADADILRTEIAALQQAVKELYDQAHATVEFSDSNEMSMDMEISAAIGILAQQRDEARTELTDAKTRIRELEQAIENLPDVCLDDVPRDPIPTLETIRRIQACRKLLPVK